MLRADANVLSALMVAPFVGSFLANAVVRLPTGKSLTWARSECPACDAVLAPSDLVPMLSWMMLRGHCRNCGTRISPIYPVIEFAAFIVAGWAATRADGWILWASCGLGWTLLVVAAIDLQTYRLLDILTLPLTLAGLLVAFIIDPSILPDHLIGALAGILCFAIVSSLYRRVRNRDGLGLGDAKLAGGLLRGLSFVQLGRQRGLFGRQPVDLPELVRTGRRSPFGVRDHHHGHGRGRSGELAKPRAQRSGRDLIVPAQRGPRNRHRQGTAGRRGRQRPFNRFAEPGVQTRSRRGSGAAAGIARSRARVRRTGPCGGRADSIRWARSPHHAPSPRSGTFPGQG